MLGGYGLACLDSSDPLFPYNIGFKCSLLLGKHLELVQQYASLYRATQWINKLLFLNFNSEQLIALFKHFLAHSFILISQTNTSFLSSIALLQIFKSIHYTPVFWNPHNLSICIPELIKYKLKLNGMECDCIL